MAGLVGEDRRRNGSRPANGQRDARRRTLNKGLRDIATAEGLSTTQQAMLFVRTSVASADALIACWNDKAHWLAWRPQTAIREAASDGNDATTADPNWTSLFPTPGYPEHPSGYNCYTQGLWYSARLFFGTDKMGLLADESRSAAQPADRAGRGFRGRPGTTRGSRTSRATPSRAGS